MDEAKKAISSAVESSNGDPVKLKKALVKAGVDGATKSGIKTATGLVSEFVGSKFGKMVEDIMNKAEKDVDKVVDKYTVKGAIKVKHAVKKVSPHKEKEDKKKISKKKPKSSNSLTAKLQNM